MTPEQKREYRKYAQSVKKVAQHIERYAAEGNQSRIDDGLHWLSTTSNAKLRRISSDHTDLRPTQR